MAKQKLVAELGLDTSKFDKGLKNAEGSANGFGGKLKQLGSTLKGALFAGGILTAFEGIKKILDSSQMSGDKLAAAMKGVSGAASAAAQSLAQADFSVSLRAAYKAAKELEEVYDDLQDRQRSLNVLSSANTLEVARLQGILRNSTKTEQERQDAAQKIKDIYAEEARLREQSTSGAVQGEIDALKTKYKISQLDAQAVLDYATNYAKYTKEQQDALNAAMEAEKKLDNYINNNSRDTRDKVVKSLKETASTTKDKVIPEMQRWINLWRPINDYSDEHRDQVAQLVIDYNNILSSRQRELNMADRINDRMGVQLEMAQAIARVTGVSGDRTPAMPFIAGEPESYTLASKPPTEDINKLLVDQLALANELSTVFSDIFSAADEGWKGMADVAIQSIKRIVTELLAKAAAFLLLSLIPGVGGAFTMPNFLKYVTGGAIGMGGSSGMASNMGSNHITAEFRINGSDLVAVVGKSSQSFNRNT